MGQQKLAKKVFLIISLVRNLIKAIKLMDNFQLSRGLIYINLQEAKLKSINPESWGEGNVIGKMSGEVVIVRNITNIRLDQSTS